MSGISRTLHYAGVRDHGLERFAHAFAEDGFVVLVHDHRGFGASDGEPRHDIDPWRQVADWRRAISYLESRPEVDAARTTVVSESTGIRLADRSVTRGASRSAGGPRH